MFYSYQLLIFSIERVTTYEARTLVLDERFEDDHPCHDQSVES